MNHITLFELQQRIKSAIYTGTDNFYWVVAEISDCKVNSYSGHCYLELIDKETDGENIKAKIRANIWRTNYQSISYTFEKKTGSKITDGTKILAKGKIDYHELYGISFNIVEIDPTYTIGDIEARRMAIIKQLTDEGVINMNKELEFPLLPQRVAIVSSGNAAGYIDFINHLKNNSSGYHFDLTIFETIMQGDTTESSVLASLNEIAAEADKFDVAVIIRGGGSRSDLSWFDNYNIAYLVTQFPIPVLTGIGHDKDVSITDMTAYKALKTPTAVANFLIDCFAATEQHLFELATRISEISGSYIDSIKTNLELLKSNLNTSTIQLINSNNVALTNIRARLLSIGKNEIAKGSIVAEKLKSRLYVGCGNIIKLQYREINLKDKRLHELPNSFIERQNMKLNNITNELKHLNPENVIQRGYSLSLRQGSIIKNASDVNIGDIIETRFRDGSVESKVSSTKRIVHAETTNSSKAMNGNIS